MACHKYSRSSFLIWQAENREVLEIVRSDEDVYAAHHRVSGMNFIPGGYAVPPSVREQLAEAESQLVVSTALETDTQPSSPALDNDVGDNNDDNDEPSTPREDVIRTPPPIPAPQFQTPPASRPANVFTRKLKSLQVNIREQGCLTRRTWRFRCPFRTRTDGHTCLFVHFRRTFVCKNFFTNFYINLLRRTW